MCRVQVGPLVAFGVGAAGGTITGDVASGNMGRGGTIGGRRGVVFGALAGFLAFYPLLLLWKPTIIVVALGIK